MRELYQRSVACFTDLAERHAGLTLAAVSHGGVLAMLYRHSRGIALDAPRDFTLHNAGINRFCRRQGAWELTGWGDIGHLEHALDDPE